MAADIGRIVSELISFRSLLGKRVLSVGAGGGQFVGLYREAREVVALDNDPSALDALRERVRLEGLENRVTPLLGDLLLLPEEEKYDLLLFEFSLHEMGDPEVALKKACTLASEVLVADHDPSSPWASLVGEGEKVARAWRGVRNRGALLEVAHGGEQIFSSKEELLRRVAPLGPEVQGNARAWAEREGLRIPMVYRFALLKGLSGS